MRVLFVGMISGIAACAPAKVAPSAAGARQTVHIDNATAQIDIDLASQNRATVMRIAAPVDRVWALLPAAYDSLGIPIGSVNSTTRTIGNTGLKIRQRLGKEYLSKYIDCGRSQIGESADSYDVVLTIFTQADSAADGGTQVSTSLDAVARPATYSQAYSRCSSKSVLEAKLVQLLRARLTS